MKSKLTTSACIFLLVMLLPINLLGENPKDINSWRGKTIMWVGPHPDDEGGSMGTMSILAANGNKIIIVMYTSGNKGSRDLEMTSERLAQIRKKEDEKAMKELGIPPESFIWLGYDDGMLEYVPKLELTEKICKLVRKYRPDALFSMQSFNIIFSTVPVSSKLSDSPTLTSNVVITPMLSRSQVCFFFSFLILLSEQPILQKDANRAKTFLEGFCILGVIVNYCIKFSAKNV